MGPIGAQEMIFIVILALLLFGPKKMPELGRLLGKGLTEFRRAKNELKTTFESHMQELERETRLSETKDSIKRSLSPEPQQYEAASYPYPYDEYGRESSSYTPSEESNGTQHTPAIEPPAQPVQDHPAPANSEAVSGTVPRSKSIVMVERPEDTVADERRSA